jgi:hypothetical protein
MFTTEDWQRAVREEGYRQQFLDLLDLGETRKYIDRILYEPRDVHNHEYSLSNPLAMVSTNPLYAMYYEEIEKIPANEIYGRKSTIKVYRIAFSTRILFADFMDILRDHEGFHAMELFENPMIAVYDFRPYLRSVSRRKFNYEREVRALRNQIANIAGCSKEYVDATMARLIEYERMLKEETDEDEVDND